MINKYILSILALVIFEYSSAQDIKYITNAPPGARLGVGDQGLPESIDTAHYYSHREIKKLAEPIDGWTNFYKGLDSLTYPQEAKEGKLESSMTVVFRVNENGVLDTVFIESVEEYGRWQKCASCEALIIDYFKNTEWSAGKIRDTPVKTTDYTFILFRIYDPNSEEPSDNPFGY